MTDTPNLKLPYLLAAQAQKHVTHNEALRALDAIVQLSVLDRHAAAPPATPADGARYIVAASPSGAWAGQASKIAGFQDGAWQFYAPKEGWLAWVADEDVLVAYDGAGWAAFSSGGGSASVNPVPMVGVNATADATNRLSVNSSASLFSHQGSGGHQLKVNKAAAADTASLLFQTGFSGRAEIGTTGNDDLHFKVSANGATWVDALTIRPTGNVGIGVSTPFAPLTIGSASSAKFALQNTAGHTWAFNAFSDGNFYVSDETAGANYFTILSNGNVGIGTTGPGYRLHLGAGDAAKPGGGVWATPSDRVLKHDIVDADLNRCWEIVKGVPLRRYTWNDDAFTVEQIADRSKLGWIAQEVQPFFRRAVTATTFTKVDDSKIEGCLSLNADQIYAAMYGALQQAIAKIETLEREVATLAALQTGPLAGSA